jgi:hypothetical protein
MGRARLYVASNKLDHNLWHRIVSVNAIELMRQREQWLESIVLCLPSDDDGLLHRALPIHARSARAPAQLSRQLSNLQGRSAGALAHAIFASMTSSPPSSPKGKDNKYSCQKKHGPKWPFADKRKTLVFHYGANALRRIDLGQIGAVFSWNGWDQDRAHRNAAGKPENSIRIAIDY